MATRYILTPNSAEFPSTNFAYPITIHTTERRSVLVFDAATSWSCRWTAVAPQGLTGTLTLVVHFVMASATTGGIVFRGQVEAITPGDAVALATATSFDTANASGTITVPGTLIEGTFTITLTNNDGMAAGDDIRISLDRNVADAGDNAAGFCYVTTVEFRDGA